jgi:dCTP deaminase
MTILSAQSIRGLCVPHPTYGAYGVVDSCGSPRRPRRKPLISPFSERGVVNGRSYGLAACSYDCRIADGLLVPVGQSRLASTVERFALPPSVCGSVLDKSSWARVFLSAFNTHLDPGWEGYLTVELTNLGTEAVRLAPGDPIVQVKFEWLDEPTCQPYEGKYSNQGPEPTPVRFEEDYQSLAEGPMSAIACS